MKKYNKRRSDKYGPEMDKDYVLNNLELAVQLLDEYNLGVLVTHHHDDIPDLTTRYHCKNFKPDFSGEDREYLNKYGPSLSDIEGKEEKEPERDHFDDMWATRWGNE